MEKNEKIVQAVVYPDQVQITRQALLDLSSEKTVFVFENVPPTADQDSFRVKAFGEGIIQIDGIEIREEALEEDFSGPLQKLNQEM
ncbi:MAG TPA: hypothetical protein DHW82_13565, partial [Spirochaetia bacterium]|nr:hypothetical protein [Spirochaetia bacterium]